MAHLKDLAEGSEQLKQDVARRAAALALAVLLTALLLFMAAGTVKWFCAWVYMIITVLTVLIYAFLLPIDLIAERGRKTDNTERWDLILSRSMIVPWAGFFLVAGLDFRWVWSPPLAAGWHLGGLAVYVLGHGLLVWAMAVNHFFSATVRIQPERGHTVCSNGPYRYIRHPGYAGMIVYHLGAPLILGSLWALIPALMTAVLFILRARLEDETLLRRLPGYRQYAARTRYRLLPGLW